MQGQRRPAALGYHLRVELSRRRAALVETRIVRGSCDSQEIVYVSAFAPGESGANPPTLEKGSYGLVARAQDAECRWYGWGCIDVALPRAGDQVVVMIAALEDETLDCDACRAARCARNDGLVGPADAEAPPSDSGAETEDARMDPAGDAGAEPERTPDASPPPEPVTISIESEMAREVQPPLMIVQDDLASGGAYISYPWDTSLTLQENQALKRATPPTNDAAGGLAFMEFHVPRSALYRMWARVIAPTLDEDSFWIRIDEGDWIQWNDISHQDQTWLWDDVRPFEMRADRFVVQFDEGPHLLRVSYRELGTKLDRLVITSELDWVPVD